jgi:hypothetical protein
MGIISSFIKEVQKSSEPKRKNDSKENTTPSYETEETGSFSDNDPEIVKLLSSDEYGKPSPALPFSKVCPSCGVVLDKPIKRKRSCPECNELIYVRTTQDLFPSSALNEEQLNHADFYMSLKSTLFITKEDLTNTESALKKKWGIPKINIYDILWSVSNNDKLHHRHIDTSMGKKYATIESLRRHQLIREAGAKYQAGRGHDPNPYLKNAHRNTILIAELDEYTRGLTVEGYNCCDNCLKFKGKTFSVQFLNKTPVLPIKNCTRPFKDGSKFTYCTCRYQQYYGS